MKHKNENDDEVLNQLFTYYGLSMNDKPNPNEIAVSKKKIV